MRVPSRGGRSPARVSALDQVRRAPAQHEIPSPFESRRIDNRVGNVGSAEDGGSLIRLSATDIPVMDIDVKGESCREGDCVTGPVNLPPGLWGPNDVVGVISPIIWRVGRQTRGLERAEFLKTKRNTSRPGRSYPMPQRGHPNFPVGGDPP
jgi:hypothetical protein